MKKTFLITGVIALFSTLAITTSAQETPVKETTTQENWDAKKNSTVDSIMSQYKDKYVAAKPAQTIADIFPALGEYESATNAETSKLSITIDPNNKGLVWIEGLPQGRVKAMLRKSPATYKIPAQKTEEGKEVAEGTLMFDKETNTLSICIGKEYNTTDPSAAFMIAEEEPVTTSKNSKAKKKTVTKPWIYTGTKIVEVEGTVMN
ncbi:MAG: hypothetical protein IPN82_15830 [Chitinophagaceae bacterium]|nr:hypothetical protein [Chitinophagaceae bacterium]MBP6477462.1 hypothetical protein [Chitinophagaceae bacterium]MBP7109205.1 hypothetical protein [Chitinophagaceae bacterium]MBP7313920.1 hypothetical protein [Chitinophagaceae bacterium]HQX96420.1 hypothetical protein [Chitinophagaceae bacterium]